MPSQSEFKTRLGNLVERSADRRRGNLCLEPPNEGLGVLSKGGTPT